MNLDRYLNGFEPQFSICEMKNHNSYTCLILQIKMKLSQFVYMAVPSLVLISQTFKNTNFHTSFVSLTDTVPLLDGNRFVYCLQCLLIEKGMIPQKHDHF